MFIVMIDPANMFFYALNLRIFGNYGWRAWSPAFMKIGCRALAFHILKNLRLFYEKIVAGLHLIQGKENLLLHS